MSADPKNCENQQASPHFPRRASLPLEVAAFLRERLAQGDWVRVLPGEMEMAREMQVGRNTIRAALAVLEKERSEFRL